jgi:hypothetical protein
MTVIRFPLLLRQVEDLLHEQDRAGIDPELTKENKDLKNKDLMIYRSPYPLDWQLPYSFV